VGLPRVRKKKYRGGGWIDHAAQEKDQALLASAGCRGRIKVEGGKRNIQGPKGKTVNYALVSEGGQSHS